MKLKLLFLFLFLIQILSAQTFTEVFPNPEFEGVWYSSIAFSDVDGDSDLDVLITGSNNSDVRIAKLYTNDGMGHFTEMTATPFVGVNNSSIAFSDVDGDSDQDVLITGLTSSFEEIAKLYTNDGMGNFTEMTDTPFDGVKLSSIAFSDVNGDGYDDVLITGENDSDERIAKLYSNDGMGIFSEMPDTPFEGVWNGSIAFSDVNGDEQNDVLITGENNSDERIAKLYTNDGTGHFTEMTDTPFESVETSSIAFSDVDGDSDQDVLITGLNNSLQKTSNLYTNDGTGHFTVVPDTPFDGVYNSSIAFSDVDGDSDQDVLITGKNYINVNIAKLYTNDGMGHFTEMTDTPFEGVLHGSIAFSDVNNDGHDDVLITGRKSPDEKIAKLYTNDGMVSSTQDVTTGKRLDLLLFPNPSVSGSFFLQYASPGNGKVNVKVYNGRGVLINQQSEYTTAGLQTLSIDIMSLPPGVYLVELDTGKRKGLARLIVQ